MTGEVTIVTKSIMDKKIKTVCVFCSTFNPNNLFLEEVSELGKLLVKNDISIIYGGGNKGLMGHIAQSVINNGGKVTAIIPEFLMKYVEIIDGIDEVIVTKDMHVRKQKMYSLSDAFVTLPGGIGTLDEMTEVLTWNQLKQHNKKLVMANFDNFWDPYISLLEHLNKKQFLNSLEKINYHVASTSQEILEIFDY